MTNREKREFEENLITGFMNSDKGKVEFKDWNKYYSNGYYCGRKLMLRATKMGINEPENYRFKAHSDEFDRVWLINPVALRRECLESENKSRAKIAKAWAEIAYHIQNDYSINEVLSDLTEDEFRYLGYLMRNRCEYLMSDISAMYRKEKK